LAFSVGTRFNFGLFNSYKIIDLITMKYYY